MEFFDKTGKMAVGSRLRLLTDSITADAADIYRLYGNEFKPKWFPVFFVLENGESKTVTAIAAEIGHSHPSVSNIVKDMRAHGIIDDNREGHDGRCNMVRLSKKGLEMVESIRQTCADVELAVEGICRETTHDLWRAIDQWEYLLAEKSLLERVRQVRKNREQSCVQIVDYSPKYHMAFRKLNEQWIKSHWELEEHDIEVLDNPQATIIDKGGFILVALHRGEPVGVCAMCTMDSNLYDYELAKLAVNPDCRGLGIGRRICQAAVAEAWRRGATKLFLESNTMLRPAINLYRKLGFRELKEYHPAYNRGDIQMELIK